MLVRAQREGGGLAWSAGSCPHCRRDSPGPLRHHLWAYFRQLVVGKIGETVQTQWHEHGSSGGGEAPSGW